MLKAEVRHIFRIKKPTNFKLGTQLEHKEPHHGSTMTSKVQDHGDEVTWFV